MATKSDLDLAQQVREGKTWDQFDADPPLSRPRTAARMSARCVRQKTGPAGTNERQRQAWTCTESVDDHHSSRYEPVSR